MNPEISQKLARAASDRVPEVDLWNEINKRLERKAIKENRSAGLRMGYAIALTLIILSLIVLTPQGQAIAQGMIHAIGRIKLVLEENPAFDETIASEELAAASDPGNTGSDQNSVIDLEAESELSGIEQDEMLDWIVHDSSDTVEKAEERMKGHVLQPSALPPDYAFQYIEATETQAGVRSCTTLYSKPKGDDEFPPVLIVSQSYFPDHLPGQYGEWQVGSEAIITDTTVRGFPGKYVQDAAIAVVHQDILTWEENGYNISLISTGGELSLAELQQIADHLK